MYRVVLIDDERLIVEGLSRVVKWADFGCEIAATAEDAVTGFGVAGGVGGFACRVRMASPCWPGFGRSSRTCR